MYRYINGTYAYDLFNYYAFIATLALSLLLFGARRKCTSVYTRLLIHSVSQTKDKLRKAIEVLLVSVESLLLASVTDLAAYANRPLGNLLDTDANYFGLLFVTPVLLFVVSLLLGTNPLQQIDIITLLVPFRLIFVKIACYCTGCCWGIPWKYGPYYNHPYHSGNQVPIQAIESFLALVIFLFLLWYRKKAKPGTVYPVYMILYSATRFPVEFLSAAHEKILGPFNTFHFFCVAGVLIGIVLLLFAIHFGDNITVLSEKSYKKLKMKIAKYEELEAIKLEQERAVAEADKLERVEKAKLAREKAKARRRK